MEGYSIWSSCSPGGNGKKSLTRCKNIKISGITGKRKANRSIDES